MDILVVEDKDSLRKMLVTALEAADFSVEACADGDEAIKTLEKKRYRLVLSDLKLPGADGIEILRSALKLHPPPEVVILTAFGTIEQAVEAIKLGASDFLSKPVDIDHLLVVVERAVKRRRLLYENILLKEEFESKAGFPRIVGESEPVKEVTAKIKKSAATDATVLLEGESGTGKELFARAVHYLSGRAEMPFVAINCAAIPENLLENELFGHEKGAYTGAGDSKMGKFELANGGTIFFDEISELTPSLQAKVLRVIQERCFERVGGLASISVDVRLVVATNKTLEEEVEEGRFRSDLFYRLNVFPVLIPPLRERKGDVELLAEHFLKIFTGEMKKDIGGFTDEALGEMKSYSWPGNVRELENAVERAVILCDGDTVRGEHLVFNIASAEKRLSELIPMEGTLKEVLDRARRVIEERKIKKALSGCGGDVKKAAEALDLNHRTLQNKLKEYEIG